MRGDGLRTGSVTPVEGGGGLFCAQARMAAQVGASARGAAGAAAGIVGPWSLVGHQPWRGVVP